MELAFTVQTRIHKPVEEVFDAVYNPNKLVKYFASGSVKGALDEGATAYWQFAHAPSDPIPVYVKAMEKNKRIVLEWAANEHDKPEVKRTDSYNTTVEMVFESLGANETMVRITESGWKDGKGALAGSYQNCSGWTQMLACLKMWIEHGVVMGMDGCSHS